jgi:hypothetical protein
LCKGFIIPLSPYSAVSPVSPVRDARCSRQVENEDLAVTDGIRVCGGLDGFHHLGCDIVADRDLELQLGNHVGGVFGAAVNFGLALLATKALHLGHGHARDPHAGEGFTHLVKPERFDDGNDEFHYAPFGNFIARLCPVTAGKLRKRRAKCWNPVNPNEL